MKRILVTMFSGLARLAYADDPPTIVPDAPDAPAAPIVAPEPPPPPVVGQRHVMAFSDIALTSGSSRGVAEEFLVLPEGAEVGGQLRTIMADGGLGTGALKLTDLALFDLDTHIAIAHHYELDATATFLPKQPSATSEDAFQGGSLTLRRDLATRTAIAISGTAGPLLGMHGFDAGGAAFVTHKHRLNEIVTFALAAGASTTFIHPTMSIDHPVLVEAAGHAAVLVRVPENVWGGWLGVGYSLPAFHQGHDPVSGMMLDPQPRLDLDLGNAVRLAENWDLVIDLAILDRGDLSNPATRLPILDGGFDQIQFTIGVSRRILPKGQRDHGVRDPLIQL